MLPLYPEIKPYARHELKVDDAHTLYVDESGELDGIPVLFVHGGPGSGCEYDSRCFFDPEKYRIILFDQRGSGRSTPHGELTANTTSDLVADMERIREFLGVERWMLFGGGWGATLSLVYAEPHPDSVAGLVLRGAFLGRQQDIDWMYRGGASRFFPDHFEDFLRPIPAEDRGDPVTGFSHRLEGADELARMAAAKAWSRWEADASTLHPNPRLLRHLTSSHRAMARYRVGVHYLSQGCFLTENQILDNVAAMSQIPGIIVHGRFDMLCPRQSAFDLHAAWPLAELHIIREAGHSATEPALIDALVRATRDMARRLSID